MVSLDFRSLFVFCQAEDGIRFLVRSRGLGDVYKRQGHAPAVVLNTLGTRLGETNTLMDAANRAIPLYLSGIAVAVGFKMNLFNIGGEGQDLSLLNI